MFINWNFLKLCWIEYLLFQWRLDSYQPYDESSPRAKKAKQKSQQFSNINKEDAKCFKNPKTYFKVHQHGFVPGERWVTMKMFLKFLQLCQVKRRFWNYGGGGQEGERRTAAEIWKVNLQTRGIWKVNLTNQPTKITRGEEEGVGGRRQWFGWGDGLARQLPGFRGQHRFHKNSILDFL